MTIRLNGDQTWRLDAVCFGAPQEYFYDEALQDIGINNYCRRCPVTEACLYDAMINRETGAVRGGLTISQINKAYRAFPKGSKARG